MQRNVHTHKERKVVLKGEEKVRGRSEDGTRATQGNLITNCSVTNTLYCCRYEQHESWDPIAEKQNWNSELSTR
jgi:hypothetical protein